MTTKALRAVTAALLLLIGARAARAQSCIEPGFQGTEWENCFPLYVYIDQSVTAMPADPETPPTSKCRVVSRRGPAS